MTEFRSFLAPLMQSYVSYCIASEFWNTETSETNLRIFDKYCAERYPEQTELTQEMVDSWCKQRETEINNSCRSRIYSVVGFVKYLRIRGKTKVHEPEIPRFERSTYIPHAFTDEELKRFFYQCDHIHEFPVNIQEKIRKISIPVFFRLLYSSGIRTFEARMLMEKDVDLKQGILNIQRSKGYNQHYIVLHDSMLDIMKRYDTEIRTLVPERTYFFPNCRNSFHHRKWVENNFRQLWDKANPSVYATAYELRHNYAVQNINQWVGMGYDFDKRLVYLSKSMGHTSIEKTKYYYSIVPGLTDILEERCWQESDWIIPEVYHEENN